MSDSIFVIPREGENFSLKKIEFKPYLDEDEMQHLIAEHPDLLIGDQINSANPRCWLLLGREVGIATQESTLSVDVVLLDQDGILTLIEVKHSNNNEIKRKVTGQLLEYAAHAVDNWKLETLKNYLKKTWEKKGEKDPIAKFLPEKSDADKFWKQVESNLHTGKVRLIFVSDKFPDELKRVIIFLNQQMRETKVYGVEISLFGNKNDDSRMVVSRVIGKSETPIDPNEKDFFKQLKGTAGSKETESASKILEWSRKKAKISWSTSSTNPAFMPKIKSQGKDRQIFTLSTEKKGRILFLFSDGCYYDDMPPFNIVPKWLELVGRLNSLLDKKLSEDETKKRMSLPLAIFKDEAKLTRFFEIMEWVIEEVSNYTGENTESDTEQPIYFYSKDKPYYSLTNFAHYGFELDGYHWKTSEHYYQAQKFVGTPYFDEIREVAYPSEAFERAQQLEAHRRKDWFHIRDEVMRKAVLRKFQTNPDIRHELLNTGSRRLIEDSHVDNYWGIGKDKTGKNQLGQILMEVREKLRNQTEDQE